MCVINDIHYINVQTVGTFIKGVVTKKKDYNYQVEMILLEKKQTLVAYTNIYEINRIVEFPFRYHLQTAADPLP